MDDATPSNYGNTLSPDGTHGLTSGFRTPTLRRLRSDPVLIKPSQSDFLVRWNSIEPEPSSYDRSADPLYGILIRISELDLSGVPRHSTAEEKYKIGQKIERQARRRHSIILANQRDFANVPGSLHRVNSAPDILEVVPEFCGGSKRVSFSLEQIQPPTYHSGLRPASPSSKPILLRRPIDQLIDTSTPLAHMDYAMFAAWRRGSRLSIDIQMYKVQELPAPDAEVRAPPFLDNPMEIIKSALFNCFSRRNCRTTPAKN